ncbi:hypothetical protein FXN63_06550 [Pigmentiphaga aceris]|uniref:Uncharacterized protein n=1 Tax=Pigmentiphaga aceris TaxID=1940612 RepID=A0A5C0AYP2_9BURK|nr:hypothetical protein [Pigmentiphaga aceris]QEI05537.1 hypothetical protein FXN63_06550 [Pigmentiphaga aceris]
MAAPRPDERPDAGRAQPAATSTTPRRIGLLNKLGNAHWGVAVGLGVLLLAVGVYKGELFAQVYGGIMIALGIGLRIVRGR